MDVTFSVIVATNSGAGECAVTPDLIASLAQDYFLSHWKKRATCSSFENGTQVVPEMH
jgi:hypothetical protein